MMSKADKEIAVQAYYLKTWRQSPEDPKAQLEVFTRGSSEMRQGLCFFHSGRTGGII